MTANIPANQQAIAIVGVSALFPGSTDATGFWRDILEGRDLITDVPASHWLVDDYYDPDPSAPDKTYARRGGFLDPVGFDALGFGIPPSTIPATDTSQLLALIVAQAVLKDAAREQFEKMDRSRISVILGVTSAQELLFSMVSRLQRPVWVKALRESGLPEDEVQAACDRISAQYVPWQESSFPGLLGNVVAGRIANRLNLGGTNCVTDAACASALSAMSMAINELQLGNSDLVISGGVDTLNDIFMYMCFSKTPALSPTGDCRPFSDKADGTMLGEGLGMVALKRLADAERDGDRIYAVIRGMGSSSDGRSKSVYAPVSEGQAQALRRAYALAGYGPETVELVEAHGTGTKAGDVAEFEGLRQVFSATDSKRSQWCALGSVKSQIGHTKAAAGAAGLFKTVMALHHKVLPPSIKIDAPNPKLDIENSPFYLNTQTRPWIRNSEHPRRASVSAFGFGGSNFHVALEEYIGPAPSAERLPAHRHELFALSADNSTALLQKIRELVASKATFTAMAKQSQRDFRAENAVRLALVANDISQLQTRLLAAAQRIETAPGEAFSLPDGSSYGIGAQDGKLAILFPGQGSQYLYMGAELAVQLPQARAVWDRAAELNFDNETALHEVVFPRPVFSSDASERDNTRLTNTAWAQPALGATAVSMLSVLEYCGVKADMVGGHSFGEVVALHAASALNETDMLKVARRRGELMRSAAVISGAMTALSLPIEQVRELIETSKAKVVVANHNAPKQVVVSGETTAINTFEQQLTTQSIAFRRLPVASAFHSSVVASSCPPFAEFLSDIAFATPAIPVYSNTHAAHYGVDATSIRKTLAEQIAQPVRFVEMIEAMYADGARNFLEVGPGSVLTGLIGAILAGRPHLVVSTDRKGKDAIESLLMALSRLAAAGVSLQLDRLFDQELELAPVAEQGPATLAINGSNVGKPYPPTGGSAALPKPNPPRPAVSITASEPAVKTPSVLPMQSPTMTVTSNTNTSTMAPVGDAWLQAFQQSQQQLTESHLAFQRAMFDSHSSFLQLSEVAMTGLASLAGGQVQPLMPNAFPAQVALTPVTTQQIPTLSVAPNTAAVATVPTVASTPAIQQNSASISIPVIDINTLMLQVVAEKTGYPVDMLKLDMDLEGDLGIDSIKRVEILAAVDEQAPGLPKLDRNAMSALHTLGEIVDYLQSQQQSVKSQNTTQNVTAFSTPNIDINALMLQVVAEKTGYPVDMLKLDMDLEGDLGIDSIKRVEILAAVDELAPGLPKLDRNAMSALHTLGEIVDYLQRQQQSVKPQSVKNIISATPAIDINALMLQVVAEKTGYPVDMLKLDMDLESDLGIDSIKRVEILAAVDEQAPGLPKLDRNAMSALHTLGGIVDYLQSQQQSVKPQSATNTISAAPTIDINALMLQVVAEKTGYPVDMLKLDMDLEGDLGIDSIKRVEILAAVDERAPGLPKLDRNAMSALHTLGEIVGYLENSQTDNVAVAADAATTIPIAISPPLALGRYILESIPAPATGMAQPGLRDGTLWIIGEDIIGAHLVTLLQANGIHAQIAKQLPDDANACLYLGGLRELTNDAQATAINREAFALARQLAKKLESSPGLFITVQDTGRSFGLSEMDSRRAWLSGLPALVKTAALEWPKATLKAIDLERATRTPKQLADALANELLEGGGEVEVALPADGQRYTMRSISEPVTKGQPVIYADDVVLVSGGARGVTSACIIEWAKTCTARFVLLGRTALNDEPSICNGISDEAGLKRVLLEQARSLGQSPTPPELLSRVREVQANREIRRNLAAITANGAQARYESVDVADASALQNLLTNIRSEWGPIRGLVHAAGVLADKRISEKTDAQFDQVFNTKIEGLRALLAATQNDPLKLLCVFSSVSARCGNTGQADYAMANEVLAKVACAQARQHPNLLVKSLGWGPWESGMVTPHLRERFAALGVPMIPLAEGARMFAAEMSSAQRTQVELVLGGEPRAEALLFDGASDRVQTLEINVARKSHAYLDGHAIHGQPVLPLVLAAEWLTRAARSFRPGLPLASLHDVKVLKGIRLAKFENGGDYFRIQATPLPSEQGAQMQMQIRDAAGNLNYSARIELLPEANLVEQIYDNLPLEPWAGEPIYQDLLFHRGSFELIERLDGISDHGISASLRGVTQAGWNKEGWQLDVAALDAGLQMAVLFGQRMLGGPNLPTGIDQIRAFGTAPSDGMLNATAFRRKLGNSAMTTDILFTDDSGRRVAELLGVHNHSLS